MSGRAPPRAVHGDRHDAHAYAASGLADLVTGLHQIADLRYVGVEGIDLAPYKRGPKQPLSEHHAAFNRAFCSIRAAGEHANARLKTWRMLSEEGGRYRAPLDTYDDMLTAIIGLHNYRISTDENGALNNLPVRLGLSSALICAPGACHGRGGVALLRGVRSRGTTRCGG